MKQHYYKLKHSPLSLETFPEELKNDKGLVAYATSKNQDAFKFASSQLKKDKEFVLELLSEGITRFIAHVDPSLQADTEIMKITLAKNGLALEHASEDIKNDRAMCDIAIEHTPYAFKYCGDAIKKDVKLTLQVLQQSGILGKDIDSIHYSNKEIIKAPLISSITYSILDKMSDELRDDKKFILELISLDHKFEVLFSASPRLKDDKEVVLAACAKKPRSIVNASEGLRNDIDVVLTVVQQPSITLSFLRSELINDKKVVLAALKAHSDNKYYLSDQLQNEIGNTDPVQYLESFLSQEELQSILPMPDISNKRRNKI